MSAEVVGGSPSLIIWPNPATEEISVSASVDAYRLLDAVGHMILIGSLRSDRRGTIDLRAVPPGVYLVSVGAEGQWSHHRLVK